MLVSKKLDEEVNRDFVLLAVATSLVDFAFCIILRNILQVDFFKMTDLVLPSKEKGKHASFSVFESDKEEQNLPILLFANRCGKDFLMPEIKQFDYLIKIENKKKMEDLLIPQLKAMEEIITVASIDLKQIKNPDILIYE